nr:myb-like protein M [Ipomoea batatas]
MDRTRRCSAGSLREHVRRPAMGFSGQSFRFAKVLVGESQRWIAWPQTWQDHPSRTTTHSSTPLQMGQ